LTHIILSIYIFDPLMFETGLNWLNRSNRSNRSNRGSATTPVRLKNRFLKHWSIQPTLRNEYFQGLHDALLKGDFDGHDVGKRTILPTSFTGGPKYMYKHYQDALAICRVHGNPQYFITFTCNVM